MAKHTLALTLAIFAVLSAIVIWRYAPPPPASADAPKERFSAARAADVQKRLVGDGRTRWAGTDGNAKGRAVIVDELTKAGWQVETQEALSCTFYGLCVPVANVVAHLDGTDPRYPGVLISAHHDSVLAGPGASDDGIGVATILETARALAAGPRPKRTVVALLTDGEEAGLTGADAFVRSHPLAQRVRATVNVDARGSSGPSQMFETSRGNAWLAPLMADYLERPVTTSLYYEVYRRMPNDTDFSITKQVAGGLNFANIERVENYHTPHDDIAHADQGTLQHHGDHVLGMTRAFANGEIKPLANDAGDAVWFDFLALFIVYWPVKWALLLAIITLALLAGHTWRGRYNDRGLTVFLVSIVPAGLLAVGLGWLLHKIGVAPTPWFAHPEAARAVMEIAPAALVLAIGAAIITKASPRAVWCGTWIGWAVLGLVTANVAPGASYLFLVPALTAGVLASLPFAVSCVVPAAVAAVLVLSLRVGLYEALGFGIAPLLSLPFLLLATTLAPMLTALPKRSTLVLAFAAVSALVVALFLPKWTKDHPQRVNVLFHQDETGARSFVDAGWGPNAWGTAPAPMRAALGANVEDAPAYPWTRRAVSAKSEPLNVPAPVFEVTSATDENGHHKLRGKVRSPRGAAMVGFLFGDRRIEMKVAGHYAYPRNVGDGNLVAILAPPAEGTLIEIDAVGEGALPMQLFDRSSGVPAGTPADAAVKARPAEAVPSQDGDVTIVSTKLSL